MHSVIGAVVFAAFALGYLLAVSGKRQRPEEKVNGESENNAANNKESVPRWRRYIHSGLAQYKRKRNERRHHRNPTIVWTRRTFVVVFFYTAVTFALFVINVRMANISKEQAEIAQKTLVMSQRPWLYIIGKMEFEYTRSVIIDIENAGNAIATYTEIGGMIVARPNFFGHLESINTDGIPCDLIPDTMGLTREKMAVPPKRHQQMIFDLKYIDHITALVVSRWTRPYLLGCIKYKWPFPTESFHTYFSAEVGVVDVNTKEVYPGPLPPKNLNGGFRQVGELRYIYAD